MAENPKITLEFGGRCPDCAQRRVSLPQPLPAVGDDFDWRVRDFDSFRRFMLEELAARFPERQRWTPGDFEVVLVEILAAVLDQLSDMADRTAAEAMLETARRPESVRRLLGLIGFDAATEAGLEDDADTGRSKEDLLEQMWRGNLALMTAAKREGPLAIHTQRRMVSVADYASRLIDHPLVLRAFAWEEWSGAWNRLRVAVVLWQDQSLDADGPDFPVDIKDDVERLNSKHQLPAPQWAPAPPTLRTLLRPYLDAFRMVGQEVILQDAEPVGIKMSLSIRVRDHFFQSEIRHAVEQALGTDPGGFFEPGRLDFGEHVYASDIFQTLMALDGVDNVCLNRFKRLGNAYPDQANTGEIALEGLEIAVCDNDPGHPERGFFNLKLSGGRRG
ncbi:hypothetical protein [Desulfosarcina ovata]|uniref:Baseplate protein J-like domain-containing protein n=1 Tax=Desulfosarcina ovata subsp. ovata TaxID=2752305 RepID=A0A5K8AAD5_9BACT|nr:hypothetical protein [Desulfosarcina ovata]BBO89459.1 hypothetical protein DSCOOX_26390 [Desulfosarcina ovata subsp. ovata]